MKANRIIAIILIILSIFLFQMTIKWPTAPAMLPKVILISIIVLSILLFIRSYLRKNVPEKNAFEGVSIQRVFITIVITVLYIYFTNILGFFTSTYLFLLLLFLYLGMKKTHCFVVPLLIIVFLYFNFSVWLRVPTPEGLII